MLRRHAVVLFAALSAVSLVLPPVAVLALVPLFWLAADRGLGPALAAALVLIALQLTRWEAMAGIALMAGATIAAARFVTVRRALLARSAAAEERLRIARELHDAVGHDVTLMVVQAEALAAVTGDERADAIAAQGRRTMAELHRVLRDDPERKGLDQLGEVLDGARAAGVPITLAVEGTPRPLPAGLDASAFRIVQEAVTNVVRHAHGAAATVTVRYDPDHLWLTVADTGGGRSLGMSHGRGLVGVRERVSAFGGSLTVRSGQDGHELTAKLPYA
jgi:signal transduction histidine kinase